MKEEKKGIDIKNIDEHLVALLAACKATKCLLDKIADSPISEDLRCINNTQIEILEVRLQRGHHGTKQLLQFVDMCADIFDPKWNDTIENVDEMKI